MNSSTKATTIPNTPWSLFAAVLMAAQFASAQEYAPASLATGTTIAYDSIVTDSNEGVYPDAYSILITSPTTFQGGTYTYNRTGPATATLNYTASYTDPPETETGTILITFTDYGVGTFTSSGSYSGNDGGFLFSGTFTGVGTFTYDGPSISNVADLTTNEDTSTGAIPFTIGDSLTAPNSLTVTRSSSNTTLVPLANVVLGGSGNNRTVTITPAANLSGTTTITLTVSDGVRIATDTFVLTVLAVNDTPTITDVTDKSTNEDTATPAIPFTIGDIETPLASLTVTRSSSNITLVPLANVVLGGSGASRTVTITPAANQNGTSTITLTVSDGTLTATDTFVLTVNAINDAPTISDVTNKSTNEDTAHGRESHSQSPISIQMPRLPYVAVLPRNPTLVPNANIVFGGSGATARSRSPRRPIRPALPPSRSP